MNATIATVDTTTHMRIAPTRNARVRVSPGATGVGGVAVGAEGERGGVVVVVIFGP
jgi:hypothetical protein